MNILMQALNYEMHKKQEYILKKEIINSFKIET